jgi:lipopolysaccharide heptosyltransferase II
MVGCGDVLLQGWARMFRGGASPPAHPVPERILLLRLERIGDLLMTLSAFDMIRARAPNAHVHLVVGSWNKSLAELVPGIGSIETLDAPWLIRDEPGATVPTLVSRAKAWRTKAFDLAINFEPDIRTNVLLALSGASTRVGYRSGGGGALLTHALDYLPREHTAANAERLVDTALPSSRGVASRIGYARLVVPEAAKREAGHHLVGAKSSRLVGLHASGGRLVKQWAPERFAQVGSLIAREFGATIVLTGIAEDRPLLDRIKAALPADVASIDVSGAVEIPVMAGLLERLALFISADTGPMHLAAAVGTPVVALFGPSDPLRYGPLSDRGRVVTADLWCRPCNRVRLPPERCRGRMPDCLDGITVSRVCEAASSLLATQSKMSEGSR